MKRAAVVFLTAGGIALALATLPHVAAHAGPAPNGHPRAAQTAVMPARRASAAALHQPTRPARQGTTSNPGAATNSGWSLPCC
jgi:hypothetical protein